MVDSLNKARYKLRKDLHYIVWLYLDANVTKYALFRICILNVTSLIWLESADVWSSTGAQFYT